MSGYKKNYHKDEDFDDNYELDRATDLINEAVSLLRDWKNATIRRILRPNLDKLTNDLDDINIKLELYDPDTDRLINDIENLDQSLSNQCKVSEDKMDL